MVLLAAAGAQTPLLALFALRRPRNLALVVVPYIPSLAIAGALGPALDADAGVGLRAVALSPALLVGPAAAASVGARADRIGALVAGTVALAFLLNAAGRDAAFEALSGAMVAFVAGAALASAAPTLRDLVLRPIRLAGWLAFGALIAVAVTGGAGALDARAFLASGALLGLTAGTALLAGRLGRIDAGSALIGAGSRDVAVATALAVGAAGPSAAAVPLAYTVLLALALAALWGWNRRKAR